ncbi:hypothetical protein BDY19DRAFT_896611 [Irpex rosettiformis]|uniref:Uncharacterized protein n=1 Tax=Irpex rosettiformis TaxID=378272 RepID=A0ACB8TTW3_9APHY|nr:hypothetical protein BDY19DRAFT_896611 [Irpex rosettiformis]
MSHLQHKETFLDSESGTNWRITLSNDWDVLGPFPIHAREQHFLSPSYPLNLSEPIDFSEKWPSAYADGGEVAWGTAQSQNGTLKVSYPHIRWASLRSTEGWAALQHHNVLRTSITVYPPSESTGSTEPPHLLIDLQQGSFFALRPSDTGGPLTDYIPQWHAGNIYTIDSASPHTVSLPVSPSATEATVYDLFVSGDYEIRLFGDPTVTGSDVPTLTITFDVEIEEPLSSVLEAESHHVLPDFIDNWAFGEAVGVGLRSSGGWWTVDDIVLTSSDSKSFKLRLLENTRIAPGQTRIVPLTVDQQDRFTEESIELEVHLTSSSGSKTAIQITLKPRQVSQWDTGSNEYQTFIATYFYATSTPTAFVTVPPKQTGPDGTKSPLLFLHGAGVNVLTTPSWGCEVPRQLQSWIVLPTGRTSWGLDWHGPSTEDAWLSVAALSTILESHSLWSSWGFSKDARVLLLGHSNGGQGAWYLAERYPDRILAVAPAAAYIKSQAYVPFVQSRSAHFIDPTLRAILETSITPDDDDLFVTNLVDTPVLAIHGGADENVPTWHSRSLVDTLKTWDRRASVTFKEDPGEPHCYSAAFGNDQVQAFIDQNINQHELPLDRGSLSSFTLTVAVPGESGSLHGFKVLKLTTPGRLARLSVYTDTRGVHITPRNVAIFSLDIKAITRLQGQLLFIDGHLAERAVRRDTLVFARDGSGTWKIFIKVETTLDVSIQPSGRISRILSSNGPLLFVIPDEDNQYYAHAAIRLAHDLDVFHKLSAEILNDAEASKRLEKGTLGTGNIVTIGNSGNVFTKRILSHGSTHFKLSNGSLTFHDKSIAKDVSSAFLHPHPVSTSSLLLVLYSDDKGGTEKLLRLFPIRTGVTVPDWIMIGQKADSIGAAGVEGAGVWGNDWSWNEGMSFI